MAARTGLATSIGVAVRVASLFCHVTERNVNIRDFDVSQSTLESVQQSISAGQRRSFGDNRYSGRYRLATSIGELARWTRGQMRIDRKDIADCVQYELPASLPGV